MDPQLVFRSLLPAMPSCILALLFYLTIGQRLQEKCFQFEEYVPAESGLPAAERVPSTQKAVIHSGYGFVRGWLYSGANLAVVGLTGALALMLTGCISPRYAYSKLSWETVFVVAASQVLQMVWRLAEPVT